MTTVQHLGQFQAPSGFVTICDPALVGEAAHTALLEAPGPWTVRGEYTTSQDDSGSPTLRALVAESVYCNPQTCGPLPSTTVTVTSGVLGIVDAAVRAWSVQTATAVPASPRDMPPCVVNAAGIFCRQPPGQYELTIYQNRVYTACDDFLYATKIVITFVPSAPSREQGDARENG